jgi:hypothetical protein
MSGGGTTRRSSSCVVFDGGPAPERLPAEWAGGPLPTLLGDGSAAGRERRPAYFGPRVGESLFGAPARRHLRRPAGTDEPAVEAMELLRAPVAPALLSAVGPPSGVAYAAGALRGAPGPWTPLVTTVVALLLTVAAFALLPPLRGLVSGTVRDRAED